MSGLGIFSESGTQQPTTGGVPASATNVASDPVYQLIDNISKPLSPELIRAATTPIAGPAVAQVPSSLQRPIAPQKDAPLMSTQGIVGKSYGRAVGIGNAITSTLNLLGSVTKMETQHKQDQLKDSATKLITAQQAIDEAKIAHDAATAAGDTAAAAQAQKTIDDNTAVRNGILADPKTRKALVKGFDISYTDPSSNKTDEHTAVMQAIKDAKTADQKKQAIQKLREQQNTAAGKAAGEAFATQQPRPMVSNVQAQQRLQLELQNKTVNQQLLKDYLTYKANMARAEAPVQAAQIRATADLMKQNLANQQKQLDIQEQFDYKMKYLDAETAARMKVQWNGLSVADAKEMDRLKIMSNDPITITKMANESDRTWQSNIESIQGRLTAATNQLTILQMTPGATPQQIKKMQDEIDATRTTLQQAQNKQAYWSGVMSTYKKMAGLPDEPEEGEENGDESGSNSSANSIKSYTGNDSTKIINEINSGTLNYNLPAVP